MTQRPGTDRIAGPVVGRLALLAVITLLGVVPLAAQDDMKDVTIETVRLTDSLYLLYGRGGNIAVSVGEGGTFMVDDQFAPLTEKILAAIGEVTDDPVRFIINTHWHGDHTGGNENLGRAGAVIVAHENVRKRMSVEQFIAAFNMRTEPAPEIARPVITFTDSVIFHLNGEEIHVFHVSRAHTDGDSIVHFTGANVIHVGDAYFSNMYPFIDAATGGRIDGVIAAADLVLPLIDSRTKVIPGHGRLSNRAELREYRDMLVDVRGRMQKLIDTGLSRDEIIAAKPTGDLDEKWGGGFLKPNVWVGIVYDGMTGNGD